MRALNLVADGTERLGNFLELLGNFRIFWPEIADGTSWKFSGTSWKFSDFLARNCGRNLEFLDFVGFLARNCGRNVLEIFGFSGWN
jgi:hypothetical protein